MKDMRRLNAAERKTLITRYKNELEVMRPRVELLELEVKEINARANLNRLLPLLEKAELMHIHQEITKIITEAMDKINPSALQTVLEPVTDFFILHIGNAPDDTEQPESHSDQVINQMNAEKESLEIISPSKIQNDAENDHTSQH